MPPAPVQKASRVPVVVAIVVSLLALGLAAAAFFKPQRDAAPAAPQYSDKQVADAKKNVCDAYTLAHRATTDAGTLSSEDPNQKFMISLNTRLAFSTAADHLLAAAIKYPEAPINVLDASRNLAFSYQRIVLAQTATASHDELEPLYADSDNAVAQVEKACG